MKMLIKSIKKIDTERLFLISIFLIASMYTLKLSKFSDIQFMNYIFALMRLISYALVVIKAFIDFLNNKYTKEHLSIIAILFMYFLFISYNSHTINYLVYYVYIVVGKDVGYNKILKMALIAISASSLLVISGFLMGFIEENFKIEGGRSRHSLGFGNAPIFANFCFYSFLYYIYLKKDKMKNVKLILVFLLNVLVFIVTRTRSAFALGAVAIIAVFIVNSFSHLKRHSGVYKVVLFVLPILLPILILVLAILYNPNSEVYLFLNRLLSGRLMLSHEALITYGVKLFGQYIRFSSDPSTGFAYNIVDSSYILYLLILGVVFYILMIFFLLQFSKYIVKKQDVYLAIVFTILLIHSTFDAQLFQMSNNYFMFILSYKNGLLNE